MIFQGDRNFLLEERKRTAYPSLSKSEPIYFDSFESNENEFEFKYSVKTERLENGAHLLKKLQNNQFKTDLPDIKKELDDYDTEG